jgi:hypothetical protein
MRWVGALGLTESFAHRQPVQSASPATALLCTIVVLGTTPGSFNFIGQSVFRGALYRHHRIQPDQSREPDRIFSVTPQRRLLSRRLLRTFAPNRNANMQLQTVATAGICVVEMRVDRVQAGQRAF